MINALRVNKELKDNCKKLASNYGSQLAVETIKKEVLLKREVIEQYSCQVDGLMVPET